MNFSCLGRIAFITFTANYYSIVVVGIFKERNPFVVPVLFLLALALKFVFISNPLPPEAATSGGLLDFMLYSVWWKKLNPGLLAILSIIIILLTGLYFNHLLTERRMYHRSHFLTALSFVIFTSIFAGLQRMQAGIIMLPFVLVLYRQMVILYNAHNPRTTVVNMGLVVGAGTLLYHPFLWMLPCCFWALAQMRTFRFNEWVLLLISFLLPVYVLISYEYLTNQFNPSSHLPAWVPLHSMPSWNPWWVFAIITSLIWVIGGFSQWQEANKRMLIQTRKNWYLLLMIGIFNIPPIFYPNGNKYEGITLLLLPASAIGAYAFSGNGKKGLKLSFFWFLIICALACSWAVINQKM